MKGQFLTINTSLIEGLEDTLREVKTSSRSSHRTLDFGIDSLVSRLVALLCLTIEVGRNRQLAYSIQKFCPSIVAIPRKFDDVGSTMKSFPFTSQSHLLTIGHLNLTEELALFPFLQIAHQTIPLHTPFLGKVQLVIVRKSWFKAEHFDEGTLHPLCGSLSEVQTCLDDLGIVEDHQGTCGQVFG